MKKRAKIGGGVAFSSLYVVVCIKGKESIDSKCA